MVEPSLLCVSCGLAPPPHRRTWNRCTICVERNLPSTYYCGEECMNAHWPQHQLYHKEQKEQAKEMREAKEMLRLASEAAVRQAEATGDDYDKRFAAAVALSAEGNCHAAAKAWRRLIKEQPEDPAAYSGLANVLLQSNHFTESAQTYLKALDLEEQGTEIWAWSVAGVFMCQELGDPLSKDPGWNAGRRTAAEIKEAATWFRRAAVVEHTPDAKQRYEQTARHLDEAADKLQAKEEDEACAAKEKAEVDKAALVLDIALVLGSALLATSLQSLWARLW